LRKVADIVGVHHVTIWRWKKQPEFAAAYRTGPLKPMQSTAQIKYLTGEAVDTARGILRETGSGSLAAKVAVVKLILDTAYRALENEDLAERIAALEQAEHKRKSATT
jgi:hypothetical protein